ncbi:MAG: SusF/SusE family outer membrane protein [Bacteroidales bacterium]|nr:SusF/SusE family outer membrane protein [Bacteroidales bacterium]
MKNIFIILILAFGIVFWQSCEDKEPRPEAILDLSQAVAPELISPADGSSIVIVEDTLNPDFPIFQWSAANYNSENISVPSYTLEMIYDDSNVVTKKVLIATTDISAQLTNEEVNNILIKFGLNAFEEDTVQLKVTSSIVAENTNDDLVSQLFTLYLTAYLDTSGGPTEEYPLLWVPGGYQGWDPASAPNLASLNDDGKYEGYVNFPGADTEFKFTSAPDWVHTNFGYGGAEGVLDTDDGASNLTIAEAGFYKFNVDTVALTWEYLKQEWGIIGSAVPPYDWSVDVDMTYDEDNDVWTITLDLTAEKFKFRPNDEWEPFNFGDDENDGILEDHGADIPVPEAGNYTVTLDLSNPPIYTFTMVKN